MPHHRAHFIDQLLQEHVDVPTTNEASTQCSEHVIIRVGGPGRRDVSAKYSVARNFRSSLKKVSPGGYISQHAGQKQVRLRFSLTKMECTGWSRFSSRASENAAY